MHSHTSRALGRMRANLLKNLSQLPQQRFQGKRGLLFNSYSNLQERWPPKDTRRSSAAQYQP